MKIGNSNRAIASKLSPQAQAASGYANNEAAILGLNLRLKLAEKSSFPAPYVAEIFPTQIPINSTQQVDILGDFFTPETTVTIGNVTISNTQFVTSSTLTVELTTGTVTGAQDLTVDNGKSTTKADFINIIDPADFIVDLRQGKTEFPSSAIETRSDMSWRRTPEGLVASGGSGWNRWIRFVGENDSWMQPRDQPSPPSLNLIFQPERGMIGIGSREASETDGNQYQQQELVQFYSSPSAAYGFYGNNGKPGTTANFADAVALPDSTSVYRLQIDNLGKVESNYYIYRLLQPPGGEQLTGNGLRNFAAQNSEVKDWFKGEIIKQGVIAANMLADAERVCPVMLPNNLSFRILGFYYL